MNTSNCFSFKWFVILIGKYTVSNFVSLNLFLNQLNFGLNHNKLYNTNERKTGDILKTSYKKYTSSLYIILYLIYYKNFLHTFLNIYKIGKNPNKSIF